MTTTTYGTGLTRYVPTVQIPTAWVITDATTGTVIMLAGSEDSALYAQRSLRETTGIETAIAEYAINL